MRRNSGFTMIELLVVIALTAVLATIGFLSIGGYRNESHLKDEGSKVAAVLQNAHDNSVSQLNGAQWGVHFLNGTSSDIYQQFSGASFATGTPGNAYSLGYSLALGNPATSSEDIIFNPITGALPNDATVNIVPNSGNGMAENIIVNTLGQITTRFETGLVGYWPMDEGTGTTAYDASGYGYNGVFVGSPNWVSGKVGDAINCGNTTSDYINVNSVPLGSVWTITAWFQYPLATTGANWHTLTRGSSYDHQIIVQRSDNQLGMYDNKTGTGFNGAGYFMTSLSNGWHFIVSVGSGGAEKFYIDGSYVGQTAHQSTSDVKSIGNHWGGGQNWGVVDDVRIYNRALSAQEIQDLYNAY